MNMPVGHKLVRSYTFLLSEMSCGCSCRSVEECIRVIAAAIVFSETGVSYDLQTLVY